MKQIVYIVLIFFSISTSSFGQASETDSTSKANILKLEFMIGNWSGSGWMMGRNGKSEFNQTELVQFKLDSTAILIEGKGEIHGKVIHNALAILTFNKPESNYTFRSYLPNGQNGDFKAEWIENKFYWYPNENVRYIIWLNEKMQWYEKGEFKRNENWTQFFEMTLDKAE